MFVVFKLFTKNTHTMTQLKLYKEFYRLANLKMSIEKMQSHLKMTYPDKLRAIENINDDIAQIKILINSKHKKMKTLTAAFLILTSMLLFTSCTKETIYNEASQSLLYVSVTPEAHSIIDSITVDNLITRYGDSTHLPMSTGNIGLFGFSVPLVETKSQVSVYVHSVKGDRIAFTDSYGHTIFIIFNETSVGVITDSLQIEYGNQPASIRIYNPQ